MVNSLFCAVDWQRAKPRAPFPRFLLSSFLVLSLSCCVVLLLSCFDIGSGFYLIVARFSVWLGVYPCEWFRAF